MQGFHLVQSLLPEKSPRNWRIKSEWNLRIGCSAGNFRRWSVPISTPNASTTILCGTLSPWKTGKNRSNEKTYVTGVRKISDELCVKHRLSVIRTEKSERVARPYALWLAEQNGTYTWKTPIQKDIEEAIAASLTWKQFLRVMENRAMLSGLTASTPP